MLSQQDLLVRGVRSVVFQGGPEGRDEAIVFVHGNPGPSDDWTTLANQASEFARVVTMDMPGYGRADRPRDFDYTVSGYARHLEGILEQLGVQRAHLVLHDFGGPWGLAWGALHKDRIASLTLVNVGFLEGYKWHKFAKIWQTPILGELFQLTGTKRLFRLALDQDNPKPMPREFVDRVWSFADWGHKRAVLKLYRASRDPDQTFRSIGEKLRGLDVPVCVVWGKGDKYLSFAYAEKQKDYLPRAEVHLLDGCGHWPFIDEPEKVSAIIVPFLRKCAAG